MAGLDALAPYFTWELSRWEVYGLFFLLGSFVVASLSDLKHLAAQREFMDVWWAFAIVLFVLALWDENWSPGGVFAVKWLLVVLIAALSHRAVGVLFSLATADVAALAAAMALLSPILVLVFFGVLKLLSIPLGNLLARGKNVYPFLPVVTLATMGILAVAAVTKPALFHP